MRIYIKNGILIDGVHPTRVGGVILENNKIAQLIEGNECIDADTIMDVQGNYICPALMDTHTHGIGGYDFNTCSIEGLGKVIELEREEGVCGFVASLVAESHEETCRIIEKFSECKNPNLLGIHLEGPYLNKNQKAVMKETFLRAPNIEEFQTYLSYGNIRSMTIAPELPHALELIEAGKKHGIVMNIGHSEALPQEVLDAEKAGAKGITHLYNAMTQHLHREPGVVTGAILSNLMCELIVDGFHIHPDVIAATYKMLGSDRIILISDSNPCKGLSNGEYEFSGKHVCIHNGEAVVKETGRIAGSTLSMLNACKNMMKYTGCSLEDALRMASYNPAKVYGVKKGQLKEDYDGDILILNKELDSSEVINQGMIYRKEVMK